MANTIEKLEIVDLLKTDKQNLADFKEKVLRRNGKAVALVHPFFKEDFIQYNSKALNFKRYRDRFINTCLNHDYPLIIFEQINDYKKLPKRINSNGVLFTVKTKDNSPMLPEPTKRWSNLVRILNDAQVSEIRVGGQWLYFYKSLVVDTNGNLKEITDVQGQTSKWSSYYDLEPAFGCVSGLANNFAESGFKTSLFPVSAPRDTMS